MEPPYTPTSVNPAYQLRWSLALFAKAPVPPVEAWLSQLKDVVERDSVRILEVHPRARHVWQFFLSTQPHVAPPQIVKSVKGRLQHLLRPTNPDAFRRNFALAAVGDARREVVENYVASQLGHHRQADPRVQAKLERYQLEFAEVDLAERQLSSHGVYIYSLHLVLVHEGRWREIREERLDRTRDMALRAARQKRHRVSRLSLLADHLHLVAGIPFDLSPEDVALSYMNNVAFAHDMQPVFCPSYYVGTIGEYDTGAIWTSLASNRGSTDTGSVETGGGGIPL
jgi:REP element-mobilizing transposase RayT